jgi:hypothetical protein
MKSYSQACQDLFAYELLKDIKNGIYLDIGANVSTFNNNTYLFELLGWTGLSIDIDPNCKIEFEKTRKNSYLVADVTNLNWSQLMTQYNFNNCECIDYISFDVDDATLLAFDNFPWNTIKFKVMTIEHDTYRVGPALRDHIRKQLSSLGYKLICSDVICTGYGPFEDWWVNPSYVNMDIANVFICDNLQYTDIITKISH